MTEMADTHERSAPVLRGASVAALAFYVIGFATLFVGERFFGDGHEMRPAVSIAGAVLLLVALLLRARGWLLSRDEGRAVQGRLLLAYAVGAIGVGLYGLSAEGPLDLIDRAGSDSTVMLAVGWPIVWLIGIVPSVFMEISLWSMRDALRLETRRVFQSGRSGLTVALAFCWLVALNYTVVERNERYDLRAVGSLAPSGSTLALARAQAEAVDITLFFPPANDVADLVEPYFAALADASPLITLNRLDQAKRPAQAKKLKARRNGMAVLSAGKLHEQVDLGLDTEEERVRGKLKRMDREVQKILARLSRSKRVIYIASGHGERSLTPREEDLPGLEDLKRLLELLNAEVMPLGLGQGLAEEIPDDASVVMIVGPRAPFLEPEQDALIRFLERGGSLMVMIDPEMAGGRGTDTLPLPGPDLSRVLDKLGVRVSTAMLANDSHHVSFSRTRADRTMLYTHRLSRHESTQALSRSTSRANLIFPRTGSIELTRDVDVRARPDVKFVAKTLVGTWADLNGNLELDEPAEARKTHQLVAAIELPKPAGSDQPTGRAIVTADADLVSDRILRFSAPNRQWVADAVHWLQRDVALSGGVPLPDEVPLMHTREEDKAWFYGAILGVPLLVLGVGIGQSIRRAQRSRRRSS